MSPANVDRADGRGWRACSHCRAKPCKICGKPVVTTAPGVTLTCSDQCRHENDLLLAREANARRAADPERQAARRQNRREWIADPEKKPLHDARSARRIQRERERRDADPEAAETFRAGYRDRRARKRLLTLLSEASTLKED